jgi:hypothetical protein
MIHWVDQHLIRWGQWVQLGQAIVPIKDIELSRTHDWVRSLQDQDQRLLFYVYCTPATARENAVKIGISLRTLYTRLHSVQSEYARGREDRSK